MAAEIFAQGVDRSFEDWYRTTRPGLVRSLASLTGDRPQAEELADEALARAYSRWSTVRRMESPGGWVYRVAVNLSRRRFRRKVQEVPLLDGEVVSRQAPSADALLAVHEILRTLPPRMRQAVALRYVADLPECDVAAAMHITEGAASSLLHKARIRLRKSYPSEP